MTQASELLKMIESVDVDDKSAMDKLNTEVYFFIKCIPLDCRIKDYSHKKKFVSSRDALKSIRPDGLWVQIHTDGYGDATCVAGFTTDNGVVLEKFKSNEKGYLTEELAELHAIIQAIEWERNNDGKV